MSRAAPITLTLAITGIALPACTDPIKLKNAATGQIAQSGPYASDMIAGGDAQAQRERECIQDFQRQGYERAP
jgi:hypothetical protein